MAKRKKKRNRRHDAAFKNVYGFKLMARGLMEVAQPPALVGELDFDTLERLPAEWFGPSLERRMGDCVWRVGRRGGGSLIQPTEFQRRPLRNMAGRVAAYAGMLVGFFPDIAGHLMAASVMSAPAALVVAKLMVPEEEVPETAGGLRTTPERPDVNVIEAAARGADVVLADTAGRLQNRKNLMDELAKVRRVADREPGAVAETLLVIDATTGQNGLSQARAFAEATDVTGVVLTKLDGSAKGGIVFAIEAELGLPVKLVGLGEGPDDLVDFDADSYVNALLGIDADGQG